RHNAQPTFTPVTPKRGVRHPMLICQRNRLGIVPRCEQDSMRKSFQLANQRTKKQNLRRVCQINPDIHILNPRAVGPNRLSSSLANHPTWVWSESTAAAA